MIKIESKLRTQFARLMPEVQWLLLKDLGFLTIESEAEQLKMVQTLLALPEGRQKRFAELLKEKLDSHEYQENAQAFLSEVKSIVLPEARKILEEDAKVTESEETAGLEEKLTSELKII